MNIIGGKIIISPEEEKEMTEKLLESDAISYLEDEDITVLMNIFLTCLTEFEATLPEVDKSLEQALKIANDKVYIDIKNCSPIDCTLLDVQASEQPFLRQKISEICGLMKVIVKEADFERERTYGEIERDVRAHPEKHTLGGEGRITDKKLDAAIRRDKRYRESQNKLIELMKMEAKWKSLQYAVDDRRSMLEYLIKLWLGDYFADIEIQNDERLARGSKLRFAEDLMLRERNKQARAKRKAEKEKEKEDV